MKQNNRLGVYMNNLIIFCMAMTLIFSGIYVFADGEQKDVSDINNSECVVRGPDGENIIFNKKDGGLVLIPKGSTITGECLPEYQALKKKHD